MTALAGHTNSYHPYSAEQAYAGLADAGYRAVELSAVPGWTEHVDVDGDPAAVRAELDRHGLEALSISGHSDLTTRAGLDHGLAVVAWAARYGLPVVNTAIGGHAHVEESEAAFLANIGALAEAGQAAGLVIALEIHGDLMATGALSAELLDRIGHPAVRVNYDTANVERRPVPVELDLDRVRAVVAGAAEDLEHAPEVDVALADRGEVPVALAATHVLQVHVRDAVGDRGQVVLRTHAAVAVSYTHLTLPTN